MKQLMMDPEEGDKRVQEIVEEFDPGFDVENPGFTVERPHTDSEPPLNGGEMRFSWVEKFNAEYSRQCIIIAQAWDGDGEEILLVWNEADRGWKRINTNAFLTISEGLEPSRNEDDS